MPADSVARLRLTIVMAAVLGLPVLALPTVQLRLLAAMDRVVGAAADGEPEAVSGAIPSSQWKASPERPVSVDSAVAMGPDAATSRRLDRPGPNPVMPSSSGAIRSADDAAGAPQQRTPGISPGSAAAVPPRSPAPAPPAPVERPQMLPVAASRREPADAAHDAALAEAADDLKRLGATWLRVEQLPSPVDAAAARYRARCEMPLPGQATYRRTFAAAAERPDEAVREVQREVQRWLAGYRKAPVFRQAIRPVD